MNRFTFLAAAASVSALGFLGCDDKKDSNVPKTMPPNAAEMMRASTQRSASPGAPATQEVDDALDDAADDAGDAAGKAADKVGEAAGKAGDRAEDAADETADRAEDAADKAGDAAEDATK